MTTHARESTNDEDRNPFTRWTDKQAHVFLERPSYQFAGLQPRTIKPGEQKAWYDNPVLCAKRDLRWMTPGSVANINGHIVERAENSARRAFWIAGTGYTFEEAVNVVSEEAANP